MTWYVDPDVVHLLRRDFVEQAGAWSSRDKFVFKDGSEVGHFAEASMARAAVDLFNLGLPLLNQLVAFHDEITDLKRSVRQLTRSHPDYRRLRREKGSVASRPN